MLFEKLIFFWSSYNRIFKHLCIYLDLNSWFFGGESVVLDNCVLWTEQVIWSSF